MTTIADLENRIRAMERMMQKIPPRFLGGSDMTFHILEIKNGSAAGNTLYASPLQYGVKKIATEVAEIPSGASESGTTATLPDGLGRAVLWTDGGLVANDVFVLLDSRAAPLQSALAGPNVVYLSQTKVALPVNGGGTKMVYILGT